MDKPNLATHFLGMYEYFNDLKKEHWRKYEKPATERYPFISSKAMNHPKSDNIEDVLNDVLENEIQNTDVNAGTVKILQQAIDEIDRDHKNILTQKLRDISLYNEFGKSFNKSKYYILLSEDNFQDLYDILFEDYNLSDLKCLPVTILMENGNCYKIRAEEDGVTLGITFYDINISYDCFSPKNLPIEGTCYKLLSEAAKWANNNVMKSQFMDFVAIFNILGQLSKSIEEDTFKEEIPDKGIKIINYALDRPYKFSVATSIGYEKDNQRYIRQSSFKKEKEWDNIYISDYLNRGELFIIPHLQKQEQKPTKLFDLKRLTKWIKKK